MQHRILGGTRRVFRAILAAEVELPVWLVTRGAQWVSRADTVSPVQGCLWGFGRTASFEYPRVWGGLADMSAGGPDDWSGFVDHALRAPVGEDQVAFRDGSCYHARVIRRPRKETGHVRLALCAPDGLTDAVVTRRLPTYRAARDAAWGDPWPPMNGATVEVDPSSA
jgi:hypothetical protein